MSGRDFSKLRNGQDDKLSHCSKVQRTSVHVGYGECRKEQSDFVYDVFIVKE